MTDALLEAYSGELADTYDQSRKRLPRWRDEEKALSELLAQVPKGGVLDCPFGTGRWNSFYQEGDRFVVGVDLSRDMLERAREKIDPAYVGNYDLREGSVFELSQIIESEDREKLKCFVCIRFLNWIDFAAVEQVVNEAAKLDLEYAIFGVSVLPADEGQLKRFYRKARLAYVNFRVTSQPDQYVHDETGFARLLASNGFNIISRKFVFENPSRKNYFILCKRTKS